MLKILAIDTSSDTCSAAVLNGEKIFTRFVAAKLQHNKLILPMLHELLIEANLLIQQLDVIAFGCGPGSFTGVRIAASIVQGLAYATNLPVVKISTLRALAQGAFVEFGKTHCLVAQDARMQEIYWGQYQLDPTAIMQPVVPDQLLAPQKVQLLSSNGYTGVGNGWKIYDDILTKSCKIEVIDTVIYPQAKYIGQLAGVDFTKGLTVSAQEALPVYLREEVAWIK